MRWQDARATAQCGHEAYPRFVACHMALQISAVSAGTDPVERREKERHIVCVCVCEREIFQSKVSDF